MGALPDFRPAQTATTRFIEDRWTALDEIRSGLTREGRQATDEIGTAVEQSLRRVSERRNQLQGRLKRALASPLHRLGFATRDDLHRVEHQVARLVAQRAASGTKLETDPSYREILNS